MGIKQRQERERESVRRGMLDAARDLFVEEGYDRVSMRKIAERIEYSPAAIYGYFPGKADIFFALAEEGFDLLHATATAEPESDDPLETLRSRLLGFYEFSKAHPEYFALMFLDRTVPRLQEEYGQFERFAALRERAAATVRRCIDAGVFPPSLDAMSAFVVLVTAVKGAAVTRACHRHSRADDTDALARDIIEAVITGLRAGTPLSFRAHAFGCPAAGPADRPGSA
jgi:AcrR family transcriptional regulator